MSATLQELVYFGTAWQLLNKDASSPPILLRGGWTGARIERSDDGLFFGGIVEKRDAAGRVTDVVLAFAGAEGASDFAQGNLIGAGIISPEALRAAALFEALWSDPRYAGATIHVTGHSLGAGYSQVVAAEAIAAHGQQAVAARADFTGFGVPNWGVHAESYYGLDPHTLDGFFTGYSARNDPTLANGGTDRVGVAYLLPAFTGLDGVGIALNPVAAHWPTTYVDGLGLPGWLSASEQAAIENDLASGFVSGLADPRDPAYGPPGTLDLTIVGSAAGDVLTGMAGDDAIVGGGGRDLMRGGGGADRFVFLTASDSGTTAATADRILDFADGDRIDLSLMDGNQALPGQQGFALVSGPVFTAPGQVRSWIAGGTTWVAGNVDADTAADFLIRIDGVHRLDASAFVLSPAPLLGQLLDHVGEQQPLLFTVLP